MTVMITRLLTGEEILGDVTQQENETFVTIENPTQVGAAPNPKTGQVDVHMAPFAPLSADRVIKIRSQNVVCQYEPVVDIVNKYNSMFGSGIIIPTNTGISKLS